MPIRLEEHGEILVELWKESLAGLRDAGDLEERLHWLYEQNPSGPAQTFLAKDTATNTIIGCGSALPWNKCVNERFLKAGVPVDFAVRKEHRTAGAALTIQSAVVSCSGPGGFDFLVASPNQKSFPIFRRIGYKTVGEARDYFSTTALIPQYVDYYYACIKQFRDR